MSAVLISPEDLAKAEVDHHSFNIAVWDQLVLDPQLLALDFRIETNRYGQIVISPLPGPMHGSYQSEIAFLLRSQKVSGRVMTECPVSTAEGVKGADNAWCSDAIWQSIGEPPHRQSCFTECPELLVEILSPSNTHGEIENKKRLYFESGAQEVWICDQLGKVTFYTAEEEPMAASLLFPDFPERVTVG